MQLPEPSTVLYYTEYEKKNISTEKTMKITYVEMVMKVFHNFTIVWKYYYISCESCSFPHVFGK